MDGKINSISKKASYIGKAIRLAAGMKLGRALSCSAAILLTVGAKSPALLGLAKHLDLNADPANFPPNA